MPFLRNFLFKFSQFVQFLAFLALKAETTLLFFKVKCLFLSIEFDKDGEYFGVAGVTKKIKIYEYFSVVEDQVGTHYPVGEMQCTSKIR